MKSPQYLVMQSLAEWEFPENPAIQKQSNQAAQFYLEAAGPQGRTLREAALQMADGLALRVVADYVQDWIVHWVKEGKLQLNAGGQSIGSEGYLNALDNTFDDGTQCFNDVQVIWLEDVEEEPVATVGHNALRPAMLIDYLEANPKLWTIRGSDMLIFTTVKDLKAGLIAFADEAGFDIRKGIDSWLRFDWNDSGYRALRAITQRWNEVSIVRTNAKRGSPE